jgi:hypothetical protein
MRIRGMSLEDIGEQLGGMVPSSVHELLAGYVGGRPIAGIEEHRTLFLARLDTLYILALGTLSDADTTKGRCDALRTLNAIVRNAAVISGAVKTPAPVVMLNQFGRGPDLSRLSVEELKALRGMQAKLIEAPIEALAEAASPV